MLFRRRALSFCASPVSRRVCHESMKLAAAARHIGLLYRIHPAFSRVMTAPSPPASPSTRPSTCRWKRGRPVYSNFGSKRHTHTGIISQATPSPPLPTEASEQRTRSVPSLDPAFERKDETSEMLDAVPQRSKVWNAKQGIRFSLAPSIESRHPIPATPCRKEGSEVHTYARGNSQAANNEQRTAESSHLDTPDVLQTGDPDLPSNGNGTSDSLSQVSDKTAQSSDSEFTPTQDQNGDTKKEDTEEQDEEETEEHVSLTYQIPDDLLRAAMSASPNTRASYWSTKLYRGPGDERISTHYCKTMEVAERVAQYFLKETVLGFDIEWRPHSGVKSIKQNASLIQLACEDRVALFHVSQFKGTTAEELMPPTLKLILESPEIIKVGVSVKGDFTRLQRYLNITSQGVFELSRLHNLVEWYATDPSKVSNRLVGLAVQVLQHLQLPLYKGGQLLDDPTDTSNVRESDWSKVLDFQQIHYAAADAYAGFRLYHMLEWKRKQLRPTPATPRLCDYDVSRAKTSTKKPKAAVKAKATEAAVQEVEVAEEDQQSEEEEGFETASEDLDSHELEDPLSQAAGEETTTTKRIGRVNPSLLRGPDPAYPSLPLDIKQHDIVADLQRSNSPRGYVESMANSEDPANVYTPKVDEVADEDEFADPSLEEALKSLKLDDNGKLTEMDDTVPANSKFSRSAIPSSSDKNETTNSRAPKLANIAATSSPPQTPPARIPDTTNTPEYNLATTWAQDYLKSTVPAPGASSPSRIRATVPHLRAYHLWHDQKLSLDDIAAHLRDPPLAMSTVTGYILQAVTLEKMEYDEDAMRDVMTKMPTALRTGRWRYMAEKVGVLR